MFINKIGYEHSQYGKNCQDFGFVKDKLKCVVDGCSEGEHSEVGAKIFCFLKKNASFLSVKHIFEYHFSSFLYSPQFIKDYLLFTIFLVEEESEEFKVSLCGDGYIITEEHDGIIEYIKIDNGKAPKYYAYNFISPEHLTLYKDGVHFENIFFNKVRYKNVGVATDGLRYILESPFKDEFEDYLKKRKEFAIKRLINREYKYFKDDITIAF